MGKKGYYVDSCIWLNLFKKEGDPTKGVPYWKIAEEFLEKVILSEDEIYYSGNVIKEIKFNINDENLFKNKNEFIKKEPKFNFIKTKTEDINFARKLESKFNFEISFYDCIHLAICKRLGFTLITRDKELIRAAKDYVLVEKPENLIS